MAKHRKKKPKGKSGVVGRIVIGAALLSIVLLWLCALSVYLHPAHLRVAGVIGLGFPFFLGGAVFMCLLSFVFAPRKCWIPLLGLLLCTSTIRTYLPVNFPSIAPKGCMKVLSYNVSGWGSSATGYTADSKHNLIAQYMAESGADIICAQEANANAEFFDKFARPELRHTPHFDTISLSTNRLAIFSAYPIVRKERICHEDYNGSGAFWLRLPEGDTLIVINCHLASNQLNAAEKEGWSKMVKEPKNTPAQKADSVSHSLYNKISSAAIKRANMADTIARFIDAHQGQSLLVCGDFNDSPVSYTHQRIATGLTDAFVSTASGVGASFNQSNIVVRIDNVLCSKDWKPYEARVDDAVFLSDHFPISCYLKRKK